MAISPNNAFVAGDVLTAQECNNFPFGVVGLASYTTANVTVTTTLADVTGTNVTFTALANRVYKFSVLCSGLKNTSATWTGLFLTNSGNGVYAQVYATPGSAGQYFNLSFPCYLSGFTPGSITVKLRAQCQTDTATLIAGPTNPLQLMVEDMGPI
jgi:hypothetical protein